MTKIKKAESTVALLRGKMFVGTSGWSYEHWRDIFYPGDLPKKEHFNFYAGQFSTVELNATFYRLFPEKTFQNWRDKAPEGFLYAVKMWRWITHRKKLKQSDDDLRTFLSRALLLKEHLGPLLVQLPPSLQRDDETLRLFLKSLERVQQHLKQKFRVAVEFRHPDWLVEEVFRILAEAHVALCLADMPRLQFPRVITSDFTYVRFHGRPRLYQSLYPQEQLTEWGDWLGELLMNGKDVFAYFNNDFNAHAVQNARQLQQILSVKNKLQN